MKCIDNLGIKYSEASKARGKLITSVISLSAALMFVIGIMIIMTFGIWLKWDFVSFGDFDAAYINVTDEQSVELSKEDSFNSVGKTHLLGFIRDHFNTYKVETVDKSIISGFNYNLLEGRYPDSSSDITLSESAISYLGANGIIGEEITLSYQSLDEDQRQETFILTGIIKDNIFQEEGYKETFIVSEAFAHISNDFVRRDVYISKKIFVSTNDLLKTGTTLNISKNQLALPISNSEMINGILAPSILVASLVILLSIVSVGNIFSYSINERIKTIGLLKSIGMTHNQLKIVFKKEGYQFLKRGIIYGFVLGIIAFLSIVLVQYLMTDTTNTNDSLLSKLDLNIFLIKDVWLMVLFMFISTFITIWIAVKISIYIPFRKTKKISITSSINYVGNKSVRYESRKNALIKKPAAKLAIINFKTNKIKSILPSIFLALSAALFIFLTSFLKSMDSRILAEGMTQGDVLVEGVVTEDLIDDLSKLDNVRDIVVIKQLDVTIPFEDVSINENFIDSEVYLNNLREEGKLGLESKLIGYNETMFNELELSSLNDNEAYLYDIYKYSDYEIGDEINQIFIDDSGNEMILSVVFKGYITSSNIKLPFVYGSPLIIVNDSLLIDKIGVTDYFLAGLLVEGSLEKVKQEIEDITEDKQIQVTTLDEIEQELYREFFLISSMGYGLFIVIGIVSFTMIINNIYTSITGRKREFAILRSIGMTKNQLKMYLLWEANIYMIFVVVISVPIGYFLSKYVVASLAEQNAHFVWTFPPSSLLIIVIYYVIIYLVTKQVFNKMDTNTVAELLRN
ncbi:ABC transporter permease [Mycoplasmatota bacterium]|nr:ABC transporter permease [Mycoplasmatota bacterium]